MNERLPPSGGGSAHPARPGAALLRLAFGTDSGGDPGDDARHLAGNAFVPDPDDASQCDFGDFRLLERLGCGGMGTIYRAHQRSLDREVALKLLATSARPGAAAIAGFQHEARHAARLQHPNIVTVFELGEHRGQIYYAMQLVRGRSLAEHLAHEGPLSPRVAAALLRTLAEAADYAHRLGVLHLDLKPGNILLDADGTPRIADFGLARRLGQAGFADNDAVSGTPSYMAPEQAELGVSRLSPATDVYALGAIGYEMLTGRPPFLGEGTRGTLDLVAHGKVRRPTRFTPDMPADLEAIIVRCLQHDPARRYPSGRALADDLGRFLDDRIVEARPLGRIQRTLRWMRRHPHAALTWALLLLSLSLGLVVTTLLWLRAEQASHRARAEAPRAAPVDQRAPALAAYITRGLPSRTKTMTPSASSRCAARTHSRNALS